MSAQPDSSANPAWPQRLAEIATLAVIYFVTARLGQLLAIPPGNITPVWLPSGIILAAVLTRGYRVWPGIFLGAFAGNVWAYFSAASPGAVLKCLCAGAANGLGDSLCAVAGAYLIQRTTGSRAPLNRAMDLVKLIGYGGVVGGGISALLGVTSLCLAGFLPWAQSGPALATWWIGDGMGVLLLTPLLLAWRAGGRGCRFGREELAALVSLAAFGLWLAPQSELALSVVALPLLLWAVFRFDPRVAFAMITAVAAAALLALALGVGPFLGSSANVNLLLLQLFLASLAAPLIILHGALAERQAAAGREARMAPVFLSVFFLLAVGILTVGYLYFRDYERKFRAEVVQELAVIAELKVSELVQYRRERLGDALVLDRNPAISQLVRRCLAQPADAEAQRLLQAWLNKYQRHYHYDEVFLLDAQGGVRVSASGSSVTVSAAIAAGVSESLRSPQPIFQDFYRLEKNRQVYLSLLVPVRDETEGDRPLGVLVLRINPEAYLFPFLKRWPTPSPTGETILTRREGNEVVYLNALRFRTNTALALRLPLSHREIPAVRAALGESGIMEGVDYRGVPVLGAALAVPDSPWFLVAKLDAAEAYAPMWRQLWQVLGMIGLLLFATGSSVGLVAWQRRLRLYRERAEQAEKLRESAERLEYALAGGELGNWDWFPPTGAASYSDRWAKLLEYQPGEFEPTLDFFKQHVHPEDLPAVLERLTGHVEGRLPDYASEHRMSTKSGGWKWFSDRGKVVLRDQAGRPTRVTGVVADITPRKRAEAALLVEKQNLDALFECSPIALLVLDATANIVRVNAAAVALIGGSEPEFVYHQPGNALRCVHSSKDPRGCGYSTECPLCPLRNNIEALLKSGGNLNGAELVSELLQNGAPQKVHFRIGAEPVMISGVRHLLVAMDDITARKQAETEILRLNAELEQRVRDRTAQLEVANRELEAFSYSVSHDLRAPLRAIHGFARILQEDFAPQLAPEAARHLNVISREALRMGRLIDDLLNFSRLNRQPLRQEIILPERLVQQALETLRAAPTDRRIELTIGELPPGRGDPALLLQVWTNLLANALKFTGARAVAEIAIEGRLAGEEVVYFVRDNGAGFDMQYADKLFGVFQRLHSEAEFEGTGVGLALVQRIVHRHGGRVWAEGKVNAGATFYFSLPNPKEKPGPL